ncbi:hypothetical protein [Pelagicoccus sp. SDUM812003]|uniref:flagellar basal body rod C-terminal domain-containing protein n=1 Tax=Pelagicoccus sp. SDUM812003 TaxID=3041267 RepID=UPI00280DF677|nr:hypothetical protein [Pelagicoccus sp. SDUM812003]MDQ8201989.1 hypothetical protein [Pelagicoccus sp. SDUM812003]
MIVGTVALMLKWAMSISPISPANGYDTFSSARQGMQRAERKLGEAASAISQGDITSSRMVDLIVSEKMYAANASVIRTKDQMLGMLIDVKR